MNRRSRHVGGTPIEEAPWWVLAILTVLLGLVFFPGLLGALDASGLYAGDWRPVAVGAGVLSGLLVAVVATRRPWRRPKPGSSVDETPIAVRLSTWVITAVMVPNVLHGIFVLTQGGASLDPRAAYGLGLLVATIHGAFALAERWKSRRRARRVGRP